MKGINLDDHYYQHFEEDKHLSIFLIILESINVFLNHVTNDHFLLNLCIVSFLFRRKNDMNLHRVTSCKLVRPPRVYDLELESCFLLQSSLLPASMKSTNWFNV